LETRRYRVGLNLKKYYRNTIIACVSCLILGAGAVLAFVYAYFYDHDEQLVAEYVETIENQEQRHVTEIANLRDEIMRLNTEARKREADTKTQLDEMQRLLTAEQELSAADFALLSKYWYVLRDGPKDGTISLDVIRYADEQCKRWNINPDWLWHIYQYESSWNVRDVNTSSGASGLGQVLPSTGRSYWTTVLGHSASSYNDSLLFNPMVNIEITTAHLGRDLEKGLSFYDAIEHYSGGGGQAYIDAVVSRAKAHGITLTMENHKYH